MTTFTTLPAWVFSTAIMDGKTPSSMIISDGGGDTTMTSGRHGGITIQDGIMAIIHLGMIPSITAITAGMDTVDGGIPIITTTPITITGVEWPTIMTTRIGDMPTTLLPAGT